MFRRQPIGRNSESSSDQKSKRLDTKSFAIYRRIFSYVLPYRFWLIVAIITLFGSTGFSLVLPLVVRNLVNVVFTPAQENLGQMALLNNLVVMLFVVFFVQAILNLVHRLTIAFVGEHTVADLRVHLYQHLQSLSLQHYADHRTGEIVSRLTNDMTLLQSAVSDNFVYLLNQFVLLIGSISLLFYIDWQLTLVIIVGIPIMSLTIVTLGKRIRLASTLVQDRIADAASIIEETISGIRIVQSFARESHEIGRYRTSVQGIYDASMRRARISSTLAPLIGFIAFGSITATLWFGSYQVLQGHLEPGDLIAYLFYTMMVATPIATVAGLYGQFQAAIGATERLFDLLDTKPTITNAPNAYPVPPIQGKVLFDQVDFSYDDSTTILQGVSFSAEDGQIVALVGPSGAGKSTLINLIPRFYDVKSGKIMIDGHDIRDVTLESLRTQIGIVPQETLLFSDTIANNIRYGKLDASDAEIEAAATAANAHHFITHELPHGYATLVGERGIKLSGGQRQRIAIARAILKNPSILILDEATSSLDSESERLVQEALDRLMRGRTSFVIAHRLSTILNANHILVLDKGQIVEQGSHHELINRPNGLYAKLYNLQFQLDVERTPSAPTLF